MKTIVLFILSFSAMANYVPTSKVGTENLTVYLQKSKCEKVSLETCLKIDENYSSYYSVIAPKMVDDLEQPVHSKSEIEACLDESDCNDKLALKVCTDVDEQKLISADFTEMYCSKFLRYKLKDSGEKIVVIDEAKKATYEAQQAVVKAQADALKEVEQDMSAGKEIYAKVRILNKSKTKAQRKILRTSLSSIRDALLDGDICGARDDITGIAVDGTLVKAEDITAVLALIDAYKVCE